MRPITRIIPSLLLSNGGLVKTKRFQKPRYIGDPINAVRIFNDKEADEVAFLNISANRYTEDVDYGLIQEISSEAFMPFSYGGGVTKLSQIEKIYRSGVEKVIINRAAMENLSFITDAASIAGSSGILVSVDVKRSWRGKKIVFSSMLKSRFHLPLLDYVRQIEDAGAGEILLGSVDRDGMMCGYDLNTISEVANAVDIPVLSTGGAGELMHFKQALDAGASGVVAGSYFVFHGRENGVLISYPSDEELLSLGS